MRVFKNICRTATGLFKRAWRLSRSIAAAPQRNQEELALDLREAERLDRIRNPSKYLVEVNRET